jgi:hypothetical protein
LDRSSKGKTGKEEAVQPIERREAKSKPFCCFDVDRRPDGTDSAMASPVVEAAAASLSSPSEGAFVVGCFAIA